MEFFHPLWEEEERMKILPAFLYPMPPGRLSWVLTGSKWFRNFTDLVHIVLLLTVLGYPAVQGCWGNTSSNYGNSTPDYQLLIGNTLVIDCTLNSNKITVNKTDYNVTSSDLFFVSENNITYGRQNITIRDNLTAQLKIPNATVTHSGIYHCFVTAGNGKPLVCSSKVTVGYKPRPVHNFRCLSRFYENLTCTWDFDTSKVATNYFLYRHYKFSELDETAELQKCPPESTKLKSCQWRSDTDPPYDKIPRNLTFTIHAQNSLGTYTVTFTVDHYSIILPRKPRSLEVTDVTPQKITVKWSSPKNLEDGKIPLKYELEVKDPNGERKVFDAGEDVHNYTVQDLIPYTVYTVSVRCRSIYASGDDMWSDRATLAQRTLPDVPYVVPETIPEAFEILPYVGYREVNLYWKPISSKYYNGQQFTYHIKCVSVGRDSEPCKESVHNVTCPAVTFSELREDTAYYFLLYAGNVVGLSTNYSIITVDEKEYILPLPEDIMVIYTEPGRYEMSWKHPQKDIEFVVFWCSSLKPALSGCEGPLQWLETSNFSTSLSPFADNQTNFRFAVAAKSEKQCSGMQWAPCILPEKEALARAEDLTVEALSSTSLKVSWRLKCVSQKAVVEKYEIIYCKLDENLNCTGGKQNVFVNDRDKNDYVLRNLTPFSNYGVTIRTYKDGSYSVISEKKITRTAEGAPSDPPQETRVVLEHDTITHNTVKVSWRPPSKPNGYVTHYVIYLDGVPLKETVKADNKTQYTFEISELSDYTNYSIRVQACVKIHCSPLSQELRFRTEIGVPGEMDPPWIEGINSSFVKVSWNSPSKPNGPIDFYEILWKPEEEANSTAKEKGQTVIAHDLMAEIGLNCESVKDSGVTYLFFVRAANYKGNETMYGQFSSPKKLKGCFMTSGLAMIIGIAIGGTLALAFTALLLFKLIKWMKDKIDQFKSITVELPKGLNGPESNQLNNYYNFMNGLNHQKSPSKGAETLSYAIGDTESKNRHGSGSSQYSNVSTDELLYRVNGKCTKFGRKPSGESSGCSSMSSNTVNAIRTPLSSDSGAESDFHAPPSPDMIFGDHKSPLPIVMESQDSSLQEAEAMNQTDQLTSANNNKQHTPMALNNNTLPNGMVIKMDQPYSKFGIARSAHTVPPWWMNPLAFYSCNLANSEPSVVELEQPSEQSIKPVALTLAPYSKVGLARSSGDILRIPNVEQGLGYSKFGIIRNVERSQSNPYTRRNDLPQDLLSPTVGVAVINMKPSAPDSRSPKKGIDNFVSRQGTPPSRGTPKPTLNYLDPRNLSPYISFKQFTQKNGFVQPRDEESLYTSTKSENQIQTSHSTAPDYVTVNEVQSLAYTPKRNTAVPSSEQLLTVVSENENYDNMVTAEEEVLNEVELDEMENLFENSKYGETSLPNGHVIKIAPGAHSGIDPYLGSDSENTEPKGNVSWNNLDYPKSPGEVSVIDLIPSYSKENNDESSDTFNTVSHTNDLDVCFDSYKLQPSPLKTQTEEGFVPTAPLLTHDTTNSSAVVNISSKDFCTERLASDRNQAKTDTPKESENFSCSTQNNVGYVPFVSLISCGNNQRNSGEMNTVHDAEAPESSELAVESVNSPRHLSDDACANHTSVISPPDSPDCFKVPEQNSARDHPTDSKPSMHLCTNSQQGIHNDVIRDQTGNIYGSPRCTKQSISMNGSLDPHFHLVPMVDSEICEV